MKTVTKTILQTTLREIMALLCDYAKDVYLPNPRFPENEPEIEFVEIYQYFAALQTPRMLKRGLSTGDLCPAIYFDLGVIEQLTIAQQPFIVQILDDAGELWLELNEDEIGEW